MRPFPGRGTTMEHKIFNMRLSRARRVIENAFGVMAVRWWVLYTPMAVKPHNAIKITIIKSCLCVAQLSISKSTQISLI